MIFKASHPVFIPKANSDGTYPKGIKLGTMMNVSVSESFLQLSALAGGKSVFQGATIALGTAHMPIKSYNVVFGFDDESGLGKVSESNVSGVEGSFHYITEEFTEAGEIVFVLYHIHRCIFRPPPHSAVASNGKSVTITNFSLTGTACRPLSGKWRTRETFNSAEAALQQLMLEGYDWYDENSL